MPAMLRLDAFAARIHDAFGHVPYLVGSATQGKQWRDVDVRLILPDEEFTALFPAHRSPHRLDLRWALLCDALSALAGEMTGLPVDFQVQQQTAVNESFAGKARVPLGLRLTD